MKENKNKWVHVRLSEAERRQLQENFSRTTERKISTYARNILLGKPMIKGVRNLTGEAYFRSFSQLLKDLNGAANNFNQAVHKLHTLRQLDQYKPWLVAYEADKRKLMKDIEELKDFINKTAAQWLQ
ncbi:hypothetical protein ABIE26_002984 [Pedobacter africanus]|uniref:plasmid mobilization protein n=1 Tax=Pedobacter africanus TaxID=151894 RepID=UPI003392B5D5